MTDLAIDTAGAGCCVALQFGRAEDVRVISRFEAQTRGQSERVISLIEGLLEEAELDYQSLKRIICTMGPGSFTGVRVGLALAKGLALAAEVPLFGVSRTLVLGHKFFLDQQEGQGCDVFACLLDAGRDAFYGQAFSGSGGQFCVLSEPVLIAQSGLKDFLARFNVRLVIGSGLEAVEELGVSEQCRQEFVSQPQDLFLIEAPYLVQGEGVKPLYLRAPDAKPQQGKALKRSLP